MFSSIGASGSPVICGYNTGQHSNKFNLNCHSHVHYKFNTLVILDATDGCTLAVFALRGTSTRNWDIRVTQYTMTGRLAGPPGCLQYFTGTGTGTVARWSFLLLKKMALYKQSFFSFNYPTPDSSVGTSSKSEMPVFF